MSATLGFVFRVEAEVYEGVVGQGGRHQDVAAVTTVTTGRASPGDELFAAEGHTAIAAISGLDSNSGFIDEHFLLPSVSEAE